MRHALAFWLVLGAGGALGVGATLVWVGAHPHRAAALGRRLHAVLLGDRLPRLVCIRGGRATTVRVLRPPFDQDRHGGAA